MDVVLEAVVLGRACRNTANIKNRQPIGKMFVKAGSSLSEFYLDIIKDELNVKDAELTEDVSALTTYTFKPRHWKRMICLLNLPRWRDIYPTATMG